MVKGEVKVKGNGGESVGEVRGNEDWGTRGSKTK